MKRLSSSLLTDLANRNEKPPNQRYNTTNTQTSTPHHSGMVRCSFLAMFLEKACRHLRTCIIFVENTPPRTENSATILIPNNAAFLRSIVLQN